MGDKRGGAACARGVLPFSGLGFDLEAVRLRAEAVSFLGSGTWEAAVPRAMIPVTWLAAGYALQLRLCREIRGS